MNIGGFQKLGFPNATPVASGKATAKKGAAAQLATFEGQLKPTKGGAKAKQKNAQTNQVSQNGEAPIQSHTPNQPHHSIQAKSAIQIAANGKPIAHANALPAQPDFAPVAPATLHGPGQTPADIINPIAKKETQVPTPEKSGTVDKLTRRVVWIDFLQKMKSKLDVGAEQILKAFTSLSPQDLAKPPEQTVGKIVAALNLDEHKSQLAKKYFQDLIQKTKSNSLGDELLASRKQIDLTLMSQNELQRQMLRHSLAQMDSKFFMKQPVPPRAAKPQQNAAAKTANQTTPWMASREHQMMRQASLPTAASSLASAMPTQTSAAATLPQAQELNPLLKQMQTDAKNVKIDPKELKALIQKAQAARAGSIPAMAAPAASPQAAAQMLSQAAALHTPSVVPGIPFGADPKNAQTHANNQDAKADSGIQVQSGSQQHQVNNAALAQLNQTLVADKQALHTNVAGQAPAAGAAGTPAMAVPDLIQQAHVMVKNGGGEMKVLLHPDGLGEVAMKVNVDHGKVNIQMITESDQAKSLIQHELGDLKAQLAAHHLHLDKLNVDTASNMGRQMERQYQNAQRQATQMAWQQFRQNNENWRHSFFEVPSAQFYKSQTEAPRDVDAPASASARSMSSRRLDLVA